MSIGWYYSEEFRTKNPNNAKVTSETITGNDYDYIITKKDDNNNEIILNGQQGDRDVLAGEKGYGEKLRRRL